MKNLSFVQVSYARVDDESQPSLTIAVFLFYQLIVSGISAKFGRENFLKKVV
jgi:hypothetical protein